MKQTRLKPIQGLASESIVTILKTCGHETSFGELQELTIHLKKSLLKYLRFMIEKKLLKYHYEGRYTLYTTTKKGEKLIKLFCYNDKPSKNGHGWKGKYKN